MENSVQTPPIPDHDLLIELKSDFKNFVRQYTVDIKDIKDGTANKLADLDLRLKLMEKLAVEYPPAQIIPIVRNNEKWISNFKLTWKLIIGIVTTVGALVGFIVNLIANNLHLFHN